MKKTLALLISAVMFVGFFPINADAAINNGINNNDLKETLEKTRVNDIAPNSSITLSEVLTGDNTEVGNDIVIHKNSMLNDNTGINLYTNTDSLRYGNLNNTVVNLRFKGEEDYLTNNFKGRTTRDVLDSMYNTSDKSINEYYKEVSLSKLNVNTNIIGSKLDNMISIELDHDRNYYMPYDPTNNTEGYFKYVLIDHNDKFVANVYDSEFSGVIDMDPSDNIVSIEYYNANKDKYGMYNHYDSYYREEKMIYEVSEKLNNSQLDNYNLDLNDDGEIDAITFLIGAEPWTYIEWGDLLWPHQSGVDQLTNEEAKYYGGGYGLDLSFLTEPCTINNKIINNHNLYTSGVILNEFLEINSNNGYLGFY